MFVAREKSADQYLGLPDTERRLPHQHGCHRRRPYFPPGPRDCGRGFHACHESQLGHFPHRFSVRATVPPTGTLGSILQLGRIRYWDIHQRSHEEEEVGRLEEEALR